LGDGRKAAARPRGGADPSDEGTLHEGKMKNVQRDTSCSYRVSLAIAASPKACLDFARLEQ
jgi:hypothetical protein